MSIDDPGTYTRPLTYTQRILMRPDTELIEYACENAKPMGNAQK